MIIFLQINECCRYLKDTEVTTHYIPPKILHCNRGFYSLSRKTVNARENFWNVHCYATNQMRDETAKDNVQTAAGISHDLI